MESKDYKALLILLRYDVIDKTFKVVTESKNFFIPKETYLKYKLNSYTLPDPKSKQKTYNPKDDFILDMNSIDMKVELLKIVKKYNLNLNKDEIRDGKRFLYEELHRLKPINSGVLNGSYRILQSLTNLLPLTESVKNKIMERLI